MKKGILITGSIDCTKITKSRLKNGKYLIISFYLNEDPDQYGNHASIVESQTKEERENKEKQNYIGNLKRWDK